MALRSWLVAAALGVSLLHSQTGAIAGKVSDPSGGVLPGVTITARSEGRTQVAVTNEKGEYRLDQLQPGQYRIVTALNGFDTVVSGNVVVEAAGTVTWNATLHITRRGPADPFADFVARVKQVIGPDPIDCGQHRLSAPRAPVRLADFQKSLACGLQASEQKKAFLMSFQVQGIEGVLLRGVAGSTNGAMYRLWYDSDTGDGTPSFSTELCTKPSVSMGRAGHAEIVCSRP